MENTQLNQYSYDTARDDDYVTFYFQEEGKSVGDRQIMRIPKEFLAKISDRITLDAEYEKLKEKIKLLEERDKEDYQKWRETEDLLMTFKEIFNEVLETLSKRLMIAKRNECHCQEYDNRW